jgi:YD repeat-containing protein
VSGDPLVGGQSTQDFDKPDRLTALEGPAVPETGVRRRSAAGDPPGGGPVETGDGFEYYAAGLLKEERNAGDTVATWTYNSRGLPGSMINGRGQKRTFVWDANGRLKEFTDPDGTVVYEYDASGNLKSSKRGGGIIFDPQSAGDQGIRRSGGTGRQVRTAAADEADIDVSRIYDMLHRVREYTSAGKTVKYDYDEAGNLWKLHYPDGKIVTYTYDKAGRPETVEDWAGRKTVYHYDENGRLERTGRPNGTVADYDYNAAGQLTDHTETAPPGNVIVRYHYRYNAAGEIVRELREPPESVLSGLNLPVMDHGKYNRLTAWN